MQRKLISIAAIGALGVSLALASGAASAHERFGLGVAIGVPAVGYAPAPYYEPAPYYAAPAAYYPAPVVAGYYGPRWGYGYGYRYGHYGHRRW
jgi:hypothetical protein